MNNENYLNTYYDKKGVIYKCIGIIDQPAVILENVKTGEQEVHVIGSSNYFDFVHYTKEK